MSISHPIVHYTLKLLHIHIEEERGNYMLRILMRYTHGTVLFRVIKSSRMRWIGHVVYMDKTNVHRIFVGAPEEVKSFGRLRCLWENNIKLNIGEMYYKVMI
jgi:hypothetical protein